MFNAYSSFLGSLWMNLSDNSGTALLINQGKNNYRWTPRWFVYFAIESVFSVIFNMNLFLRLHTIPCKKKFRLTVWDIIRLADQQTAATNRLKSRKIVENFFVRFRLFFLFSSRKIVKLHPKIADWHFFHRGILIGVIRSEILHINMIRSTENYSVCNQMLVEP